MKYIILIVSMCIFCTGCEKGGDSISIETQGDVNVVQESSVSWEEMTEEEKAVELDKIDAGYYE